jgi:hypothetical protein
MTVLGHEGVGPLGPSKSAEGYAGHVSISVDELRTLGARIRAEAEAAGELTLTGSPYWDIPQSIREALPESPTGTTSSPIAEACAEPPSHVRRTRPPAGDIELCADWCFVFSLMCRTRTLRPPDLDGCVSDMSSTKATEVRGTCGEVDEALDTQPLRRDRY